MFDHEHDYKWLLCRCWYVFRGLSNVIRELTLRVVLAFLGYEYLITLDMEVALFWKKPLTGAGILFFVNRYLTLVWAVAEAASPYYTSPKVSSFQLIGILYLTYRLQRFVSRKSCVDPSQPNCSGPVVWNQREASNPLKDSYTFLGQVSNHDTVPLALHSQWVSILRLTCLCFGRNMALGRTCFLPFHDAQHRQVRECTHDCMSREARLTYLVLLTLPGRHVLYHARIRSSRPHTRLQDGSRADHFQTGKYVCPVWFVCVYLSYQLNTM